MKKPTPPAPQHSKRRKKFYENHSELKKSTSEIIKINLHKEIFKVRKIK